VAVSTIGRMNPSEWMPVAITAVLGSAGIASVATQLVELTRPQRIRKRLHAACELAEKLPPGAPRQSLEAAIARDALHLSAMSLVPSPRRLRYSVVALCAMALFVAVVILVSATALSAAPGAATVAYLVARLVPPLILVVGIPLCLVLWTVAGAMLTARRRRLEYVDDVVAGRRTPGVMDDGGSRRRSAAADRRQT
jgi:hypothetical protein